ncbi:SRPBCC family protein [Wenzhouxiangella sp. AB-CW3]|uniref:SRPBCC family protein n=1 Tax=Wenzhouxiangella sp. AB-CW3 TaxID=2771012 RepID=UPI00168BF639|nr:SRPBCC family protein [Wenzhouxiangella sp. AB-CW3]QOC21145.1 SRPBCC family protein [Wenzhouxiangella sp. AB-CW3]
MLRRLLVILLAVVIVLVIVGFMLPRTVAVERDRVFDHPRENLFAVLSDLRHFTQWSPWLADEAPDSFRLEGRPSGIGSTLVWREEADVGASRMWITSIDPLQRIDYALEFGDRQARGWFVIEDDVDGYRVRWGMGIQSGTFDLVGRYLGLLLPGMIGRSYEEGLDDLADYLDAAGGDVPALPESLVTDFLEAEGFPE